MGLKTAGVGQFMIPTAPAAGTSVTSGAANTFTTTAVQLIASTASALYITGISVEAAAALGGTYYTVQLMIGGAGSETVIGQYDVWMSTGSTVAGGSRSVYPLIPVANATRISVKTADSVGSKAVLVKLECIADTNVVAAAQIATGVWQDAVSADFTTASSIGKSLYTTGAPPGAANGIMISGANVGPWSVSGGVTFFNSAGNGFTCSSSGGNGSGAALSGNGTGMGLLAGGGATGHGIQANSGATSGIGIFSWSQTSGAGFQAQGGSTSGDGIAAISATSGNGVTATGAGTGHGVAATSGAGATGDGIRAASNATNGNGLNGLGKGTGVGLLATGGASAGGDGIKAVAGGGVDFRGNQTGNLVGTVSTLTTYTGNTPQTGDAYARLGAPAGASVSADVAAINAKTTNLPAAPASTTNITAGTITTVTNLTNAPTAGDFTATMKTSITTAATSSTPTVTLANGAHGGAAATLTLGGAAGLTATHIGNQTGNVSGSVGSVTARVTANTDQLAGQAVTAAAGVTFPTSIASPTNITAGTITTTTNLTNAPTAGDFTAAMKTSLNAATPASVVGAVGSVTGNVGGNVVGSVASVTADVGITQAGADKVWASAARTLTSFGTLVADTAAAVWAAATRVLTAGTNIVLAKGTGVTGFNDIAAGTAMTLTAAYDAAKTAATQTSVNAIPTAPLLAASYTAPDNASIAAIKAKTDNLTFSTAGEVDANLQSIRGEALIGTGAAGDEFRV